MNAKCKFPHEIRTEFCQRGLRIADAGGCAPHMGAPEALRSNGWGCRVIGTANEE